MNTQLNARQLQQFPLNAQGITSILDEIVTSTKTLATLRGFVNFAPLPTGLDNINKDIWYSYQLGLEQFRKDEIRQKSPDAATEVARVKKCVRVKLNELAIYYINNILIPYRASKKFTGWVGSQNPSFKHPQRGGAGSTFTFQAWDDRGSAADKVKQRDGYKCLLTGRVDPVKLDKNWNPDQNTVFEITQAAHIIPFALNTKKCTATSMTWVWNALENFAGVSLKDLKGSGINDQTNIITLSSSAHHYFDALRLSFEPRPANIGNNYGVVKYGTIAPRAKFPDVVEIIDDTRAQAVNHANHLDAPKQVYLNLHCAIVKCYNASGMADIIDKYLEDYDDTGTRATDPGQDIPVDLKEVYKTLIEAY
ncbi:hypothetical protein JAAARDRAFT_706662 [Jaapia argillacea MUCL 33604]|uniref:HNH nuclease domain-containing protein n=1 Tax=Jaapia argillacea MUCL 33604 TaxID=933084 RepID=A0A067PKW8_9AGAM|nr:hypothetical protein JAAARDRAFT_706662 [Jaapia argillacea MUCL 33604]